MARSRQSRHDGESEWQQTAGAVGKKDFWRWQFRDAAQQSADVNLLAHSPRRFSRIEFENQTGAV
jgi:hypothetical protein